MSDNRKPVGGGVGLFTVLGIIFVVLKLCKVISWSWVWVLSPFWMPLAAALLLVAIWFITLELMGRKKRD